MRHSMLLAVVMQVTAVPPVADSAPAATSSPGPDTAGVVVRINQLGYHPDAPKVAVACVTDTVAHPPVTTRFRVLDRNGRAVISGSAVPAGAFAGCHRTARLDFSRLAAPGRYRVEYDGARSPVVRIAADAFAGAADTLLYYMRQQRSGYNPLLRTHVHRNDGIVVDHPTRGGVAVAVTGGWADASDYLQYVATSANATFVMLMAHRDHPRAFADAFTAAGDSGGNGVPDVLDEARHGLDWLLRMFPDDSTMFNQLGDDRDHSFLDLPHTDSSDYGWGKGGARPVYPCTGEPQGLFQHRNRSNGYASTAGKYASAFALAARTWARTDPAFAERLRDRAVAAYALGQRFPGVCQTAPARAPYFYEEDNWVDDMELAAAELHALTRQRRYLDDALRYAGREAVTPWMGADTARHYQWYPWHNNGHHETWRTASPAARRTMAAYYRRGLRAVIARADANPFRIGVPFIWCSNNLVASFATQALLYRRMTGDAQFRAYEQAAVDWLFGANPWGVSMVIGLPHDGAFSRDPHSVVARQLGVELTGGLLDGPVYASIYRNLRGITLHAPDEFARFNTGTVVFHDDFGDYSTNEPIMDGTANLAYLLAAYAPATSASSTPANRPRRAPPAARRAPGT